MDSEDKKNSHALMSSEANNDMPLDHERKPSRKMLFSLSPLENLESNDEDPEKVASNAMARLRDLKKRKDFRDRALKRSTTANEEQRGSSLFESIENKEEAPPKENFAMSFGKMLFKGKD